MSRPETVTKAINLRIEHEHEQLVRDVIGRIRKGGPGFRAALRALIDDEKAAEYVPAQELRARFADIERRMLAAEDADHVPSSELDARFAALEARLAQVEQMALERITRLGADSCGG